MQAVNPSTLSETDAPSLLIISLSYKISTLLTKDTKKKHWTTRTSELLSTQIRDVYEFLYAHVLTCPSVSYQENVVVS